MKVSDITVANVATYLKLETGEYDSAEIENIINISKLFISNYTGIPIASEDETIKTIDDYEDFVIVVYVLCQDMYDNRSLYTDKTNLNKVVDTILSMHCINLL